MPRFNLPACIFLSMGTAHSPEQARLFLAVLYSPSAHSDEALELVKAKLGSVELCYGPIPFSFTDYYQPEMGEGLQKTYLTFCGLIDRVDLASIKVFTNEIEQQFLLDGHRSVNLDPGYITRDKLVLATTKDFYHRIYLAKGIYGEVTLHFRDGKYRYFSWTYPDYKEPAFQEFLMKARAKLVGELRKQTD
jgi:hypothetical protein